MTAKVILTGILITSPQILRAEDDKEVPLGIEAVTGIRSNYIFRGIELSQTSLDFQVQAELVLNDKTSFHFGVSHLAESSADFSETSPYLELSRYLRDDFLIGASFTYRDRNEGLLSSGFDFGLFSNYAINDDWLWRNEINFDFGEDAFYINTEIEWSHVINKDSFISIRTGLSYANGYLDRTGLNDFHTRLTYTYNISDVVSVTPFIGSTTTIASNNQNNTVFGGLWFEVIF